MAVMAGKIWFINGSSDDVEEEEDIFPALFAETHPLPAATPASRRNIGPRRAGIASPSPRESAGPATWTAARKERVA
jgi:hypothetical protein